MSQLDFLLLARVIYVVAGTLWAGAAILIAGFLMPAIRGAGPAGAAASLIASFIGIGIKYPAAKRMGALAETVQKTRVLRLIAPYRPILASAGEGGNALRFMRNVPIQENARCRPCCKCKSSTSPNWSALARTP